MCSCGIDSGFVKSRDGILKLIEFKENDKPLKSPKYCNAKTTILPRLQIFCLLILIVVSASDYTTRVSVNGRILPTQQMAYVNFVGCFGAITLLISYFIYFFKLYTIICCKLLPWKKLEIIYALGSAVLNFISIAVAGHSSANSQNAIWPSYHNLFATAAVFSAIVMLLFIAHAFLLFRGDPPRSEHVPENQEPKV